MTNLTDSGAPARVARAPRPRTESFGEIDTKEQGEIDFGAIQRSTEFRVLRRTHRRFVFPVCAFFFAWYMLYVLLSAYAHDFMAHRILGQVNVGIALGLLQFVSTAVIIIMYSRFAERKMEPKAEAIRKRAEGKVR